MSESTAPPLSVSELIDRVQAMREELLSIQRAMEKMESKQPEEAPD